MVPSDPLQIGALLTGLIGGLALFLYGMRKMTEALKTVAGNGMKNLLAKMTTNRFTSALAGIIITAIIQSSSVTTVLVVGFVSAGLLSMSQSIGVILGAAVGSTITAQIIAFKVTQYALALIGIGFLTELLARKEVVKHWGIMFMGLGLIFFGMELMSQATYPLRSHQPFIEMMQGLTSPVTGILIGIAFTAIVQSSSATTGVVIVLAGQGFISLPTGIALVFGANIGTCITAMLATIGKPREAVRTGLVHVIYKVVGVLIWLPFIAQLAVVVQGISPSAPHLEGMARLAAESPRQIANAHTLFNLVNLCIFIWLTGPLARLVTRLVPDRKEPAPDVFQPAFLDAYYLQTPALALDQVKMELGKLGEEALHMARASFGAVTGGERADLDALEKQDDIVDARHGHIITYLGHLSMKDLIDPQPKRIYEYIAVANYLENVGDVVETNLIAHGRERLKSSIPFDESILSVFRPLHENCCLALEDALYALAHEDADKAKAVARSKDQYNAQANQVRQHLVQYLSASPVERLPVFRIGMDVLENLKRIHTLARRIAGTVEEVELAIETGQDDD